MGVLYSKLPETIKKEIVDPYISIKDNEARISLRIKDSEKNLRRNDLINQIQYDLENKLGLKKDEFKLAGILILFNNPLELPNEPGLFSFTIFSIIKIFKKTTFSTRMACSTSLLY